MLDGNRAIASPSSSESTEVDTNQEGDSATGPTGLFFLLVQCNAEFVVDICIDAW